MKEFFNKNIVNYDFYYQTLSNLSVHVCFVNTVRNKNEKIYFTILIYLFHYSHCIGEFVSKGILK